MSGTYQQSATRRAVVAVVIVLIGLVGLIPLGDHYLDISAIRNNIAQIRPDLNIVSEDVIRARITEICANHDVELDQLQITKNDATNRIDLSVSYVRTVRILYLFSKTFRVQITDSTTNLGI